MQILFTRTPSIAEGGPGHDFAEGRTYEVSPRSARRWISLDAAVPAPPPPVKLEVAADVVEIVEVGGQAPPIIVPEETRPAVPEEPPIIVPAPVIARPRPTSRGLGARRPLPSSTLATVPEKEEELSTGPSTGDVEPAADLGS